MKNSPANGPGTPPVSMAGYVSDGLGYQDNVSQMNLWEEYIHLWKMLNGLWLLPKVFIRRVIVLPSIKRKSSKGRMCLHELRKDNVIVRFSCEKNKNILGENYSAHNFFWDKSSNHFHLPNTFHPWNHPKKFNFFFILMFVLSASVKKNVEGMKGYLMCVCACVDVLIRETP